VDGVTEKFPRYTNIFEESVGDSMAIVVRRSRDIYSVVSFTYHHGSDRDQTSIMWIFAQLGWKIMAYWGYFAESARVGEAWLHCCTADFTLLTIHIFSFWVFLLCDNCRGRCFPLFSYSYLVQPECVTTDIHREILARASTRIFELFRLLKHAISWEDISLSFLLQELCAEENGG
jgi:hypothetical protein